MEFMVPIAPVPSFTWDVTKDEKSQQSFEGGWLQQFFDSAFFCEWIAVTYLYKQDNEGVREYLCNRMYSLPEDGIQDYLFQLCYLAVHNPCPPLERYLIDICRHNLHAGLRMNWFLAAELADLGKDARVLGFQASCLEASLLGSLPLLKCPRPPKGPSSSQRVLHMVSVASRRFLPLSKQEQALSLASAEGNMESSQASRRFMALGATPSGSKLEHQQQHHQHEAQQPQQQENAEVQHASSTSIVAGAAATASARLFMSLNTTSSTKSEHQQESSDQHSTNMAASSPATAAATASSAAAAALSGVPLKAFVAGSSARSAPSPSSDASESTLSRLKNLLPQGTKSVDASGSTKKGEAESGPLQNSFQARASASPPVSPTHAHASGFKSEGASPASSSCSTPVGCSSPSRRAGPLFRAASGGDAEDVSSLLKTCSGEKSIPESKDGFLRTLFWRHDEQRAVSEVAECSSDPDTPGSAGPHGTAQHPSDASPTDPSPWISIFRERRIQGDGCDAEEKGSREASSSFWRFFRSRGEEGERDEEERQRALVVGELGVLPEGDETEVMSTTSSEASYPAVSRQVSNATSMLGVGDSESGGPARDSFLWRIFTSHKLSASADGSEGSALNLEDDDLSEGLHQRALCARSPAGGDSDFNESSSVESQADGPTFLRSGDGSAAPSGPSSPQLGAGRAGGATDVGAGNCSDQSQGPELEEDGNALREAITSIEKSMLAGFLEASPDSVTSLGISTDPRLEKEESLILSGPASSEPVVARAAAVNQTPLVAAAQQQGATSSSPLVASASGADGILKRFFKGSAAETPPQPDIDQEGIAQKSVSCSAKAPVYLSEGDESDGAVSPRKGHERTGSMGSRFMGSEGGLFSKMFRGKVVEDPARAAEILIAGVEGSKADSSAGHEDSAGGLSSGHEAGSQSGSLFRKLWSGKGSETGSQPPAEAAHNSVAVSKTSSCDSQALELRHSNTGRGNELSWSLRPSKSSAGDPLSAAATAQNPQEENKGKVARDGPSVSSEQHKRNKSSGEAVEAGKQVLHMLYRNTVVSAAGAASGAAGAAIGAAGAATSLVGGAARGLVEEAASLVRGKPPMQPANDVQGEKHSGSGEMEAREARQSQGEEPALPAEGAGASKGPPLTAAAEAMPASGTPEGSLLKKLYGSTLGASNLPGPAAASTHINGTAGLEEPANDTSAQQHPALVQTDSMGRLSKASPRFIRRLFEEKEPRTGVSRLAEEGSQHDAGSQQDVPAPHIPIPLVDAPAPVPQTAKGGQGSLISTLVGGNFFGAAAKGKASDDPRVPEPDTETKDAKVVTLGPSLSDKSSSGTAAADGETRVVATTLSAGFKEAAAADTIAAIPVATTQSASSASSSSSSESGQSSSSVTSNASLGSSVIDPPGDASGASHVSATLTEQDAGGRATDPPAMVQADQHKDVVIQPQEDPLPYPKRKLPKHPAFTIRTDTMCATMDFVKALGDISLGLVDVFPHAHRVQAMQESLSELNAHLAQMSNSEGVFFPMGKGLHRIVRIPEEESVVLSSRERVPFMIFIEILNCEPLASRKKEQKGTQKLAKSGIPLASGQTAPVLPRPPPWALHMWSNRSMPGTQGGSGLGLSRTLSDLALDRAMASLYSRMKVVGVSIEVRKKPKQHVKRLSALPTPSRRAASEHCSCIISADAEAASTSDSSVDPVTAMQQPAKCAKCGLPPPVASTGEVSDDAASEAGTEDTTEGDEPTPKWDDRFEEYVSVKLVAVPGVTVDDVASVSLAERGEHRRVPSSLALAHVRETTAMGQLPPLGVAMKNPPPSPRRGHPLDERMEDRKARIRKSSKFGSSPDWDLRCVIVKSGDDCRQEHLALQLVSHFKDIFQEAGLPLWLRPYEILVTSSRTALIEAVTDSVSLHTLKGRYPQAESLRDYFEIKYGAPGTASFRAAQQNFVESMAAYSIVCYLLQVKDRHNGNILLDDDGHVIHIDFGFMLSNSPGGVNFENAPFKLTREMLEVMDSDADGLPSEAFDYFKVLFIQGFLTCRKQSERILLLVEMMQRTRCPCFKAGTRVVHHLRKRFHLTLPEEQSVSMVLSLISKSVDSWRTRQYDYYQKVLNGIL